MCILLMFNHCFQGGGRMVLQLYLFGYWDKEYASYYLFSIYHTSSLHCCCLMLTADKHHRQYNYGYFVEQSFDEFSSWFVSVFFKLVVTCFGLSCLMSICQVVVANIGDAKAVLARSTNGSQNHPDGVQTQLKAIVLTREHKPIFQLERARIEKV